MSDELPINRGVRQGDPLSPKLFTAVMEGVFKKADISEEIDVDGGNLTNLRFVYDFAVFNEPTPPPPHLPFPKQMGKILKHSELRKFESWPKTHKGKANT